MNNCLILLLLLCCCGNGGSDSFGPSMPCGRRGNDGDSCGDRRETRNDFGRGRDSKNDCSGNGRESRNNDSCMERGFSTFPSPGGTCGCEEKE